MSSTQTVTLSLELPEELYQGLRVHDGSRAEDDNTERVAEAAIRLLEEALRGLRRDGDERPSAQKPFDFEEHFGAGKDLWRDDEDFEDFRQRARKVPYMDVARLARPDGETERVPFRITPEMASWLEGRQKVLAKIPKLKAFYDTINGATATRHILAQFIIGEEPLEVVPPKGGRVTAISLPRELYERLEARLDEVKSKGARSSAGVGTVIRWVLAATMAKGARQR